MKASLFTDGGVVSGCSADAGAYLHMLSALSDTDLSGLLAPLPADST